MGHSTVLEESIENTTRYDHKRDTEAHRGIHNRVRGFVWMQRYDRTTRFDSVIIHNGNSGLIRMAEIRINSVRWGPEPGAKRFERNRDWLAIHPRR